MTEQTKPTPGPIERQGCFLWQLNVDAEHGLNLWSCLLQPQNGFPPEHAEQAARLFHAAPDLLAALEALVERGTDSPQHIAAERAIASAKGQS